MVKFKIMEIEYGICIYMYVYFYSVYVYYFRIIELFFVVSLNV